MKSQAGSLSRAITPITDGNFCAHCTHLFLRNRGNGTRIFFARVNMQNWLQRVIWFVLAATIAVLAFFFLTVVLIAGAVLASFIAVRWWWITRKLRPATVDQTFEGEYTVIEHSRGETPVPPRDDPR